MNNTYEIETTDGRRVTMSGKDRKDVYAMARDSGCTVAWMRLVATESK